MVCFWAPLLLLHTTIPEKNYNFCKHEIAENTENKKQGPKLADHPVDSSAVRHLYSVGQKGLHTNDFQFRI